MKTTLWSLALGVVFGGGLMFAVVRDAAPPDVGEFTWDDREMLRSDFGGGRYLSNSLYVRCEKGSLILYYADGARLTRNRSCWK